MASSLIQSMASLLNKCYTWKRSYESRKRTRRWISFIITIILMIKAMYRKGVKKAGRRYGNMDQDTIHLE